MEALDRFARLVAPEHDRVPLDEAWALVGAHAHPESSVDDVIARLDALAERVPGPTLDHLRRALFDDEGFVGNVGDYYDPENSYAPAVLDRRTGIPITLAIVTLEVGRRVGVPLWGVSMPGHFLLRDKVDPEVFVDPFARGRVLDRAGCEQRFREVHGPSARLDPAELEPVDERRILARVLANLRAVHARNDQARELVWVLRLLLAIPGVPPTERKALAAALTSTGDFAGAAAELERLAEQVGDPDADEHRAAAVRLRARLN